MSINAVTEFPFCEALPKREKSRVVRIWESLEEARQVVKLHGFLLPVKFAAGLADVSRQRIDELVSDGVIVRIDLDGHAFITEDSFVAWAKTERKQGRPLKVTRAKLLKVAFATAKDSCK